MRVEASGDGDRTAEIQAVLDAHSRVSLGPGLFMVSQLELRSSQHVSLDPRTVLRRLPDTQPGTCVVHVVHQENVLLEGGLVDGNSNNGPGEQAHAVALEYASDIEVRNLTATRAPSNLAGGSYGDGVYIGHVSRLLMRNVKAVGNDRHGSQISHLIDAVFERCTWGRTVTQSPGSALNLEGNDATFLMQNLTFRDCIFEGATTQGITCNNHSYAPWRNLFFDRCLVRDNGSHGFSSTGASLDDALRFEGTVFERNVGNGLYSMGRVGPRVRRCRFFENGEAGLRFDNTVLFDVGESDFIANGLDGVFLSHGASRSYDGDVWRCRFFNNGRASTSGRQSGLYAQSGYSAGPSGLRLVGNRTGNLDGYGAASQAWGFFLEGVGSYGVHMAFNRHDGNTLGAINTGSGDNATGGTHVTLVEP